MMTSHGTQVIMIGTADGIILAADSRLNISNGEIVDGSLKLSLILSKGGNSN